MLDHNTLKRLERELISSIAKSKDLENAKKAVREVIEAYVRRYGKA